PASATLCPYTTLFRSQEVEVVLCGSGTRDLWLPDHASAVSRVVEWSVYGVDNELPAESYTLRREPGSTHGIRLSRRDGGIWLPRSEEHTSELQSRENL